MLSRSATRVASALRASAASGISAASRGFHARALATRRDRRKAAMRFERTRFMSAVTMNVPEMGDSITEGTIAGWSKAVGEYVELDEANPTRAPYWRQSLPRSRPPPLPCAAAPVPRRSGRRMRVLASLGRDSLPVYFGAMAR